ncbi:unnamed protein product [Prorocentrum cordatum]|uniref:Uncharacterized protein n=1 Tax=Prorocentrum cordatum TaxID=2364126 RepID=A0ABN9Q0U8_9DINO|nr:unnamed protein product [Polarella glacialis]
MTGADRHCVLDTGRQAFLARHGLVRAAADATIGDFENGGRLLRVPPAGAELACATSTPRGTSRRDFSGAGGLHFCIFQGGEQGVEGWALDRGSVLSRWDALLDGLLQCVVMDGEWPREVRASAFVGRDSVHLGGEVQEWAMPVAGPRDSEAAGLQPDTFQSWEDALWWSRGAADLPGLRWRLATAAQGSPQVLREQQLASLREELARLPEAAAVLAFTPARPDVSYDRLVELGEGRTVSLTEDAALALAGCTS